MLTADLVRARRRGEELRLTELDAKGRAAALELATTLLDLAAAHVGKSRAELDEVCDAVVGGARDRRLAAGLLKLIEDQCDFAEAAEVDPADLRREVFSLARAQWLELGKTISEGNDPDPDSDSDPDPDPDPDPDSVSDPDPDPDSDPDPDPDPVSASTVSSLLSPAALLPLGARFDRLAVLSAVAASRNLPLATVEAGLYADLRAAQILTALSPLSPAQLVAAYELAQPQAVLLRAVRVTVWVESAVPGAYRTLFRKLKFLRLLYTVTPHEDGGYLLEIDGPYSLFESATRYGLALALALPAIRELDRWKLTAEIRWGTERTPLTCRLEGRGEAPAAEPTLPDDLAALVAAFEELDSGGWKVAPATAILDLPGVGVCVPDLTFRHKKRKLEVHLEVLGYWSRSAVWRRVELVQAGLGHRIVFAVGQQLRVSEAALDGELPGALYVYKRTMSAKALLERIEAVATTGR